MATATNPATSDKPTNPNRTGFLRVKNIFRILRGRGELSEATALAGGSFVGSAASVMRGVADIGVLGCSRSGARNGDFSIGCWGISRVAE